MKVVMPLHKGSRAQSARRTRRGVALIEALVALLVMAFGMVAVAGLLGTMRRSSDLAKQRGEALRIAQQHMEMLRDYSVLDNGAVPAFAGQLDYVNSIKSDTPDPVDGANARYAINTTVDAIPTNPLPNPPANAPAKSIRITVSWNDRAGVSQHVTTDSYITRADPVLGASPRIAPTYTATQRPPDGKSVLPPTAKDLGGGKSVLIPQPGGTVALVFNNISGVITSRCTIAAGTSTVDIHTSADLTNCSDIFGFALWGYVNFASATPLPTPLSYSYAVPIDLAFATGGPSYECFDNAPVDATGPQTVVAYACVVYPTAVEIPDPKDAAKKISVNAWSGELDITGLTLGSGNWKVCRYSGNYDGNATISNAEHPQVYDTVQGALGNQNFLVIKYSETCPTGASTDTGSAFWSKATVQHQPNGVATPTTVH